MRNRTPAPAPATPATEYSFCEPVTATTMSREHIRRLGPEGRKRGGGILVAEHGLALCGYDISRGWDNEGTVDGQAVQHSVTAEVNSLCQRCAAVWAIEVADPADVPDLVERIAYADLVSLIPSMTTSTVAILADHYEGAVDCEDDWAPAGHADQRCAACVARDTLKRRKSIEASREPGADPSIYIPGVQTATYFSGTAADLRVGDVTRHRPHPGSRTVVFVRAVAVHRTIDGHSNPAVFVDWASTNLDPADADTPHVEVTYAVDEDVDIHRTNPIDPDAAAERKKVSR